MNRSAWAVVLGVLWLGCGGPSELDTMVASRQDPLLREKVFNTVIPPLPALPDLVDLDRGEVRGLFPKGVASAVTALYRDARDEKRFYAVGFDVHSEKACFYVTGTTSTQLAPLRARLEKELVAVVQASPGAIIGEHMLGYVVSPYPGGPGPGPGISSPFAAWQVVSAAFAAGLPYSEGAGKE